MKQENTICRNCNTNIQHNFCPNCGQRKYQRINGQYIKDEFQGVFIHSRRGLFYTLKKLMRNPGKTAREYINGERAKHYKPVMLALLLASIGAFLSFKIFYVSEMINSGIPQDQPKAARRMTEQFINFFYDYYSLIMLALIPFFSLGTYLGFRKWGDNFYEHIVANAFFQSYLSFISILMLPFSYYFMESYPKAYMNFSSFFTFISYPLLFLYFIRNFYASKPLGKVVKRFLLTLLFWIVLLGVLMVLAIIITTVFVLVTKFNPKG